MKEKVIVYTWETPDMTAVQYETKIFIRQGWYKFIPSFLYSLFAMPDFEFAGTIDWKDWVNEEHFLETEFGKNNELVKYIRDKYNVSLDFECLDITGSNFAMEGGSEYFRKWTGDNCDAELQCVHPNM